MVIIFVFHHGNALSSLVIVIMMTLLQSVGYDDGRGILKCSMNRVKKGETAMRVKRGKEQPVNEDRGSKHAQVWLKLAYMATRLD